LRRTRRGGATEVANATTGARRSFSPRQADWRRARVPSAPSAYRYVVPVSAGGTVSYGGVGSHHDYPAADIFAANPGACAAAMADPYAPDA